LNTQESYASFMMDHAAGNQADALALAGDIHMMLSPSGAEQAQLWSIVGGALLERDPAPANTGHARPGRRRSANPSQETAQELLALADGSLEWKRGISGVSYANTRTRGAKFMRLDPGQSAPAHGHGGLEATVVLQGRFSDGHGVYSRGDLVLGEPGKRHKPAAVGDETCICFVAETSHPLWNLLR
jgi:predicted ChrR family anti-sigma factor